LDENIEFFSYLPHLRSVKLVFESGIDGATPYAFSQSFVSRVSALQNLTEVSLTWEVQRYIVFSSLVALFLLPSLRVLYLSDVVCGDEDADDDEDIIPELLEQVKRKSGVKDLTLDFAMVESGPLIALLQLPSPLEKFGYSLVSEGIYHRNTSAGRFFDLLYPQRNTMKEIDIIGCRDVRGGRPFRGLCAKQALNYFPVLKTLGCPAEILKARWEPDENMWHEDLCYGYGIHEALPASLERLKLYCTTIGLSMGGLPIYQAFLSGKD
jgi:hypothetical protein